ncbi:MAG: DUF4038 domain-containing protein [Collinsella sp.]
MSLGKLTVNGRQDGFCARANRSLVCRYVLERVYEHYRGRWDYYLTRRAEQGMNVLQINTLPQWDRCCPDLGIWPYASEDGVHFDWSRPNQAYWDRAAAMCRAAVEHGIRPALVVCGATSVPGAEAPRLLSVAVPRLCRARRSVPTLPASSRTGRFDPSMW